MKRMWLLMCAISLCCITLQAKNDKQPVDYVNTLMGTDSKISLSNGNTTTTDTLCTMIACGYKYNSGRVLLSQCLGE